LGGRRTNGEAVSLKKSHKKRGSGDRSGGRKDGGLSTLKECRDHKGRKEENYQKLRGVKGDDRKMPGLAVLKKNTEPK